MVKEENYEIEKIDAIDNLFLQKLRRIGFTGYPLDDISKFIKDIGAQIKSQISGLKTLLEQLASSDSFLNLDAETLQIIIPTCFYT